MCVCVGTSLMTPPRKRYHRAKSSPLQRTCSSSFVETIVRIAGQLSWRKDSCPVIAGQLSWRKDSCPPMIAGQLSWREDSCPVIAGQLISWREDSCPMIAGELSCSWDMAALSAYRLRRWNPDPEHPRPTPPCNATCGSGSGRRCESDGLRADS